MSSDEISNYIKGILTSISRGVNLYKMTVEEDKKKLNNFASGLISAINQEKEEFVNKLNNFTYGFDEISKVIEACENSSEVDAADNINNSYCTLIKDYKLFNLNYHNEFAANLTAKLKSFESCLNSIFKIPIHNNLVVKVKESNESKSNNNTIIFDYKEEIKLNENEDNNSNLDNSTSNSSKNKKNKASSLRQAIDVDNIENKNSEEKPPKSFLGKKRQSNFSNNIFSEMNHPRNKEKVISNNNVKNDSEIASKLKAKFPNYKIDFKEMLPYLRSKTLASFEFSNENIDKTEKTLKEFLKENASSISDKTYILLKINETKPDNCIPNSVLFNRLKEFFHKRSASFKQTEFLIGGLPKYGIDILAIFEEIYRENFLEMFSINSIAITIYYFFEDILNDIEEYNEKSQVHNIEKKESKENKELQQKLKKLRKAYITIINEKE